MRARFAFLLTTEILSACAVAAPPRSSGPASMAFAEPNQPSFEALAVGPLTNATPLQIVSIFPYEAGETLLSPALEIGAFLESARVHDGFGREALRTVLVQPPPPTIKAERLLAIAWGPRSAFSVARSQEMGHAAMREAIARGVEAMAYAPIARDQGVTSIDADVVAAAFVEGAVREFRLEARLDRWAPIALKRVTYEAGPAFVDAVAQAVARGVLAGQTD